MRYSKLLSSLFCQKRQKGTSLTHLIAICGYGDLTLTPNRKPRLQENKQVAPKFFVHILYRSHHHGRLAPTELSVKGSEHI